MSRKLGFTGRLAVVSAIAVAVFAGPGDGAQAAGAPTSWRVLTVPTSPEASALLENPRVRVIASYGSFTLVEASGAAVKRLLAVGGEFRDDMKSVRIGDYTFDPATAATYLSAKAGDAPRMAVKGGSGMVVIHFVGPLKQEWLEAIEGTGVELVDYMPENAQLVAGDTSALAALTKLVENTKYVRAVVPYSPMFKLRAGIAKSGVAQVVISTAAGKAGNSARAEILRLATPRGDQIRTGGTVQQRISVDAGKISEFAELGGVVAIESFVEPKLHDERSGMIVANKLNGSFQPVLGTGYLKFLADHGLGNLSTVIVDVTDEGIDKGIVPVPAGSHRDLYRNGNIAAPSRLVYAQEATAADSDARDCGGHGTNVAGIVTGFNKIADAQSQDAQGFNYGLGIQPFGQVGATKIFNCVAGAFDVTTSIAALHSTAYANGARISNNSWGSAVGGAYNTRSQEFDALVRDAQPGVAGNQQFVEITSAGNSGSGGNTIGSPGTAKNVITVGAAEGVRPIGATDGCGVSDLGANSARDIIDFSSRGPTDDGRIKPDVVAPGTHIVALQPQTGADYNGTGTCNAQFPAGSTLYNLVSGTSQAAPTVSGFASLIHTWYRANLGNNKYPSPAMTKALMINTATDLAGGEAGNGTLLEHIPNHNQGWGRINLGNLLDGTIRDVVDQTALFKATGQVNARTYKVADPAKPLRITLVWTDAVGPTVGNASVNNLDLEVVAGGNLYKGNVFLNGLSTTGGNADAINNVENVFLPAGVRGAVSVRVVAKNIASDGVPGNAFALDQDFALVVSNAEPVAAVGVPQFVSSTVTPVGGGVIGPNDTLKIRVALKNAGTANLPSFNALLKSVAADATVQQGTSNYGAIAMKATVSNTTVYNVKVAAGLTCGKPVRLSLTGNAGGQPFTIPFQVPTGSPGAPVTTGLSNLNLAIPDNLPAGVTSERGIQVDGAVADMRVTIGEITHTFIGDLTIDLTSPDGTTVRLFTRRGGSGDNIATATFSDAAATPISAGTAPFTGSFLPEQPLSVFDGKSIKGKWKLTVKDSAGEDTGVLKSWSLTYRLFACN